MPGRTKIVNASSMTHGKKQNKTHNLGVGKDCLQDTESLKHKI